MKQLNKVSRLPDVRRETRNGSWDNAVEWVTQINRFAHFQKFHNYSKLYWARKKEENLKILMRKRLSIIIIIISKCQSNIYLAATLCILKYAICTLIQNWSFVAWQNPCFYVRTLCLCSCLRVLCSCSSAAAILWLQKCGNVSAHTQRSIFYSESSAGPYACVRVCPSWKLQFFSVVECIVYVNVYVYSYG